MFVQIVMRELMYKPSIVAYLYILVRPLGSVTLENP